MSYGFPRTGSRQEPLTGDVVSLEIVQQPKNGLVTQEGKEKTRKPVDPPPIVRMRVNSVHDATGNYLQSPYLFMTVHLASEPGSTDFEPPSKTLAGQTVSSLHRLKDPTNDDGAFFVFGDLSVRRTGTYVLCFSLWEMTKETFQVSMIKTVSSNYFTVFSAKEFPGLSESTYLSRAFSDQGVRLRLRKEPRAIAGNKRAYYSDSPPETSSRPGGFAGGMTGSQYSYDTQMAKRQRSDNEESSFMVQPSQLVDGYRTTYNSTANSTASFVGQPSSHAPPSIFGGPRLPNQEDTTPTHAMAGRRWPSYSQGDRSGLGGDTQGYRLSLDLSNPYLTGQQTHHSTQYAAAPSNALTQHPPGLHTPISMPETHGMNALQSRGFQTAASPISSTAGRPPLQTQYSHELQPSSGVYGQEVMPLDLQSPDESYADTQQSAYAGAAPGYSQHAQISPAQPVAFQSMDPPPREGQLPIRSESGTVGMPTLNSSMYHQFPPQPGGPTQPGASYPPPPHPNNPMHRYDGR